MNGPAETTFAARLHVLMAASKPYAVILRRGPSKRVCTIGWDRENDKFQVGQWFKGRIFERRSDISPDGRHLIYFAAKNHRRDDGTWTAVSRAPYLKAIGFWTKGDSWHGGGLFVDSKTYWINQGYGHNMVRTPSALQLAEEYPNYGNYGSECTGVYYLRLLRDGWTYANRKRLDAHHSLTIFEKRINDHWILRKLAYAGINSPKGNGCYYDRHEIENLKTGEKVDGYNWEWADVDRHRVCWAENGKLFAGKIAKSGLIHITELHDFNTMEFEAIAAPY